MARTAAMAARWSGGRVTMGTAGCDRRVRSGRGSAVENRSKPVAKAAPKPKTKPLPRPSKKRQPRARAELEEDASAVHDAGASTNAGSLLRRKSTRGKAAGVQETIHPRT